MLTKENLETLSSSSGSFDSESIHSAHFGGGGVRVLRTGHHEDDEDSVRTNKDSRPSNENTMDPASRPPIEFVAAAGEIGAAAASASAAAATAVATTSTTTSGTTTSGQRRRIRPISLLDDSDSESASSSLSTSRGADAADDDRYVWYFAYGSNMNVAQLLTRIGAYIEKVPMKLEGYQLTFSKRAVMRQTTNKTRQRAGFANVEKCPGSVVHGVGYLIRYEQLLQMDRFEGVKQGHYFREELVLSNSDNALVTAWVYIACPGAVGEGLMPLDTYLSDLLGGRGLLPEYYVRMLEATPTLSAAESSRQLPF